MLADVQIVAFIERAGLWKAPPIFYPCVLELMHEPEKAAETGRHLKQLLGYPIESTSDAEDTEGAYKPRSGSACNACTGMHAQRGAPGSCLLSRCIRSRAAASLLVRSNPADCVPDYPLLLCCS